MPKGVARRILQTRHRRISLTAKYPEAIIEFRKALQIDPLRGDIRMKLGEAYARSSDGGGALREFTRAADLLPKNVDAQINAGTLLLLAGSYEDAKARADRALEIDPKNTTAQILRGNALARLKDFDGAVSTYEDAIALDPTKYEAYVNLGAIQAVQGKRDEAEATFKKAIDIDPKSVPARLALANFYWASKRPRGNREHAEGHDRDRREQHHREPRPWRLLHGDGTRSRSGAVLPDTRRDRRTRPTR